MSRMVWTFVLGFLIMGAWTGEAADPDEANKAREAPASATPIVETTHGPETPPKDLAVPQVLKTLEARLRDVLAKSADPAPTIEYHAADGSLHVGWKTQRFQIHSRSKTGEVADETHEEIGPSHRGFVLKVHVQPVGTINAAVTPQTLRQPYWDTDLSTDVVTVSNPGALRECGAPGAPVPLKVSKQLYWSLSYGSQTEKELLERIRAAVTADRMRGEAGQTNVHAESDEAAAPPKQPQPEANENKPRIKIGEVLGKPVYADEIRPKTSVRDELGRLFLGPLMEKYRRDHKQEIEPTEPEIQTAIEQSKIHFQKQKVEWQAELEKLDKQLAAANLTDVKRQKLEKDRSALRQSLDRPLHMNRESAIILLEQRKFQQSLYKQYGGGRILFQQFGLEAFDAMHKWLEASEKKGDFQIVDPNLRTEFYHYWTTMNHGAFLSETEEVRADFLEPKWLPKRPVDGVDGK